MAHTSFPDIEILKVGHHGSSTSTSEDLLKYLKPECAILSYGKNNDYGHPHRETLELLNKYKVEFYETAKLGEIRIESDGKGTIFTTTGCLLAPHRNQPMTQRDIDAWLKRELCAERILWIDHGHLTGDDTDGHIDTLVRICPDDTLLYVGCDDPEDEQYDDLRLMEEQLKTFRTLDDKPYQLMKLPMPDPIYEGKERLPATYANFLIVNGAVLCPTYAQPDLDREALRIIGAAFPDREIVGIDCRSVIKQHGSLHCCTMQFPERMKK